MKQKAASILKKVFGYDEFRPLQADIIENILNRRDCLVIMPTGGGKSICYQIPALIFEGLTIVISPLISLMKDQVEQLRELGVEATLLNSTLSPAQYRQNVIQIKERRTKLLYLAPESLLKQSVLEMLSSIQVDCMAIDEAHCISEWGHDFRPEYRQLAAVRARFSNAVCVALTATATQRVRDDIKKTLHFDASGEYIGSFNRENLFLEIVPKNNPLDQTIGLLERYNNQSGIIYCFSRRQVDDLYEELEARGYSVRPYHAGLPENKRNLNQELFIRDDVRIIIATIAFGMGINKSNVRFVIHYDLPKNIESYYQEIGRAGRDGLRSHCMLLFSYGDIQKIKYFINEKDDHEKRIAGNHLNALVNFAEIEECRRVILLNYFGEKYSTENCGMCDNCLSEKREKIDITIPAQKFLSCVKRSDQIFGAAHIIDILRGSQAKKVLKFGHQNLSTYAIGIEYSKKQWLHLSRQFLHQGLVAQDMEYGSLRLTEKAWDVLKGRQPVSGHLEEEIPKDTPDKEPDVVTPLDYDRELFDILKDERKRLADYANLPPYVIFHDRTLLEMATYFPQSFESLLDIHGVGEAKLEKYGQSFLDIIQEYCGLHQIEERSRAAYKKQKTIMKPVRKRRHHIVGDLYNAGRSIPDIMNEFNIKQTTVLDNLYKYLQEGYSLQTDEIINYSTASNEQRNDILKAFERYGPDFLRPVFDALNGTVDYEELKIMRLYYLYINNIILDTNISAETDQPEDRLMYKQIVCLANSRKFSGRCIAGKEILKDTSDSSANGFGVDMVGGWIRPVSRQETRELSVKEITLKNGDIPEPLDIISVPIAKSSPYSYQRENCLIEDGAWVKNGKFPLTALPALCDYIDSLWMNCDSSATGLNDRMPVELMDEKLQSSLLLIKTNDLSVIVEEGANLLKRIRAEFEFKDVTYRLSVTDPVVESIYLKKDVGSYLINSKDMYLCVSISEPFNGYCYKLIAGVITNLALN